MLGRREMFEAVPFFWTQQYGVSIKYVGHAEAWDDIEITGSLDEKDCAVAYKQAGRTLAVATISGIMRFSALPMRALFQAKSRHRPLALRDYAKRSCNSK
jgi:hypothetical protein